jgi:hypothetical protein
MKIKTSELTGAALDWAVAEADGTPIYRSGKTMTRMDMDGNVYWQPSTDWAHGGPIIEREEISTSREFASSRVEWAAWTPAPIRDDAEAFGYGPTPLIAAMRCYVASKLGDEVEIPEELK